MKSTLYSPGLNTLRFIAATLVIIEHGQEHLKGVGINWHNDVLMFNQAGSAVRFFFVLSGFLLTRIAVEELRVHNTINIKYFYVRRSLRILPLYYLVIFGMVIINSVLNPLIMQKNTLGQPLLLGTLLNVLMLPNLAKLIWPQTVGGLGLLWSIGVEEQFYLFFPHLIRLLNKINFKLLLLVLLYGGVWLVFYLIHSKYITFESEILRKFIDTLRFDYMLMGSIFAFIMSSDGLIKRIIFQIINNKLFQITVYLAALAALLFFKLSLNYWHGTQEALFFAIIIVIVSCPKDKLINFEIKPFTYFGAISFGLYLWHPFVSYGLRFVFFKMPLIEHFFRFMPVAYMFLLLAFTIILAHFSYKYYESRFMNLKRQFVRI